MLRSLIRFCKKNNVTMQSDRDVLCIGNLHVVKINPESAVVANLSSKLPVLEVRL